jgi:hypothetical protein
MDETGFWISLEFRVSAEFAGMPTREMRRHWCDGFIPEQYLLDDSPPRIVGRAWICEHQDHNWEFALLLPHSYRSREEIDWESLLPPDRVTRWMTLDARAKRIELEPAAAVADNPVPVNVADNPAEGTTCSDRYDLPTRRKERRRRNYLRRKRQ